MAVERLETPWQAESIDIGRRRAGHFVECRHSASNHVAVLQIANSQQAINSFANEIDESVALAHVEFNLGIRGKEGREVRLRDRHEIGVRSQQGPGPGERVCWAATWALHEMLVTTSTMLPEPL
jgi:hypothetical protein